MRPSDWDIDDFETFASHATRLANELIRAWEGQYYKETTKAEFYECVGSTKEALQELLNRVDFDWLYCEDCGLSLDHDELLTGQQCERCYLRNKALRAEAAADEAMFLYASMTQ